MSALKATSAAMVRAGIRLGFVLAVAGLVAGCGFQPLYGRNPSVGDESVRAPLLRSNSKAFWIATATRVSHQIMILAAALPVPWRANIAGRSSRA
jgi:hypothetical protein